MDELCERWLRGADWRFLLPNPRPRKSVCFAGGSLAGAVALVSERRADPRLDPHDCDLAVVVNPGRATLRAARAALGLGGSLYAEWWFPVMGGPRGIRRRLEAAGFGDVRCYRPWRRPSRPRAWLPLEASGALRHFLASRSAGRGAARRFGRAVADRVCLLGLRRGLIPPVCVTARKGPPPARVAARSRPTDALEPPSGTATNPDLLETVRANWDSWRLGEAPDQLSSLLLAGGRQITNRVVSLVFAEPDPTPRLVVKRPRVPESVPGLLAEAEILRAIWTLRPSPRGIPRVLSCQEHAGTLSLYQTALPGVPLFARLRRDNYRHLALKATAWLVDFAGQPRPRPREAWWGRLIEPVLADFERLFGEILDPGLVRETRGIVATLGALPLVCRHGDFAWWNLLIAPHGEFQVLDWEDAELEALPALDLVFCLTYLAFAIEGADVPGRRVGAYRTTLDRSTLVGRVRGECLALYADRLGLEPSALRPLCLLTWLVHARSEYKRLAGPAGGPPGRDDPRRNRYVGLWEAELRHGTGS